MRKRISASIIQIDWVSSLQPAQKTIKKVISKAMTSQTNLTCSMQHIKVTLFGPSAPLQKQIQYATTKNLSWVSKEKVNLKE